MDQLGHHMISPGISLARMARVGDAQVLDPAGLRPLSEHDISVLRVDVYPNIFLELGKYKLDTVSSRDMCVHMYPHCVV